jgi:UDP-glucose 4-epimerase
LALHALERGATYTAYNLGNGQGFSVREVIQKAEQITNRPIPLQIGPRRAGDPPRLVADARRIRHDLGWTPQWPDLHSLLDTAWRWQQSRAK